MGNCPCAPLGMECVYEKWHKDLLCCSVHILNYHLCELWHSVPIIGEWLEPYHCPDFEIERKGGEADA